MKKSQFVSGLIFCLVSCFAVHAFADPPRRTAHPIRMYETGFSTANGGIATGAYAGTCSNDSVVYDKNGARGCTYTTDTTPAATEVYGKSTWAQATTDKAGGNLNLCPGIGRRKAVVSAALSDPAETLTITLNGTTTTFTDGTDFTSTGTDAALATAIAALLDALTGVSATASSDTIYVERDPNELGVCTLTMGGTNGSTITSGTDGAVNLPVGASVTTSTALIGWASASQILGGTTNGNIRLSNAAASDFGLLQFGGTTSSFPAWKRSGASMSLRFADDSGDAHLLLNGIRGNTASNGWQINYYNTGLGLGYLGSIWFSSTTASGTADIGMGRSAAGVLRITDGLYSLTNGGNLDVPGTASTKGQTFITTSSSQTLTADGSATEVTSGLIPDGAILLAITTRISTTLSGGGVTGYQVGDGTDADMYGVEASTAAGGTTDNSDWTADGSGVKLAAGEVTITWTGGSATAGVVRVTAHYQIAGAPTSN